MLINKTKVKMFTLEIAKGRAHKFTRVGSPFYWLCDAKLKEFIRSHIHSMPSKGKTIL
jgi:hypothetical protein